ncbi:MAG: hypothetical protein AB7K52_15465 [Phycisphaerales bacterium]
MARSGEHYMPRPDGNFSAWANHYYEAVKKWWDANGFDPTDLKPLETALAEWNADYPAHIKAQAAAEGARQAKDAARAALEKEVRPVTNFVQGYPKTTNADRAEMGITVRDTSPSPAPAPSSRPLALVESGQRLTHQLRLVDESTPTRRARPAGVLGAEVWVKLVDADTPAPTDPAALTFLTMTTKPSFRADFKPGEGGKTAVYMARWVNTRGEKGPWSEVTTATVAA